MLRSCFKIFIAIIVTAFFISCASENLDPIRQETKGWTVEQLYAKASSELKNNSYSKAIKYYEVLEATYPYGSYSQLGMLDLAYAYYQNDKPEAALPEIDMFIRTYPTNTNMDYALYLKGYINYKNDNGLLSRFSRQDLSERDPIGLKEAYTAFYELASKYPNSRYAPDAKDKLNRLVNALARGELYRARYYMNIKAYLAAINRSQSLIINYPNTQYVEEALALQAKAYDLLNEKELSKQTLKVLQMNFPKGSFVNNSWEYQDIPWYSLWH